DDVRDVPGDQPKDPTEHGGADHGDGRVVVPDGVAAGQGAVHRQGGGVAGPALAGGGAVDVLPSALLRARGAHQGRDLRRQAVSDREDPEKSEKQKALEEKAWQLVAQMQRIKVRSRRVMQRWRAGGSLSVEVQRQVFNASYDLQQ